jgi:hypothetical protein
MNTANSRLLALQRLLMCVDWRRTARKRQDEHERRNQRRGVTIRPTAGRKRMSRIYSELEPGILNFRVMRESQCQTKSIVGVLRARR